MTLPSSDGISIAVKTNGDIAFLLPIKEDIYSVTMTVSEAIEFHMALGHCIEIAKKVAKGANIVPEGRA